IKRRLNYLGGKQCLQNVVYEIPVTCGGFYIGQTGNCATARISQHKYALNRGISNAPQESTDLGSKLVEHCVNCDLVGKCVPLYDKCRILAVVHNVKNRLLLEALFIDKTPGCFSTPSVAFTVMESSIL